VAFLEAEAAVAFGDACDFGESDGVFHGSAMTVAMVGFELWCGCCCWCGSGGGV